VSFKVLLVVMLLLCGDSLGNNVYPDEVLDDKEDNRNIGSALTVIIIGTCHR
jgi:hypothetical protein